MWIYDYFKDIILLAYLKTTKPKNHIDIVKQFKNQIINIKFILNEETVRKIKNNILSRTRNYYTLEDIWNSVKLDINDIQIDSLEIKRNKCWI